MCWLVCYGVAKKIPEMMYVEYIKGENTSCRSVEVYSVAIAENKKRGLQGPLKH